MKKAFLLFAFTVINVFSKAQNVYIPDANFKAYLVGNSSINTNGDNEIQKSEAIAFTGTIDCSAKNISTLIGIEEFVNITSLMCTQNQLTTLDISKNTALTYLDCSVNQLADLDISKNILLNTLWCYNNQLISLDISKNTVLIQLGCYRNLLTNLNISTNTALQNLICYNNQITNLDLSKNLALKELYCYRNQLTTLDISKNTALTMFFCDQNQLTSLNLKNGNNVILTQMDALNNPNLTCIQVDNVANANSYSNWKKDTTASYDTDCLLSVNDAEKPQIKIYPNPVKDVLHFSQEIANIKITDISGKMVKEISANRKSVNIANLSKGVYIISAITKSGEKINQKIVKE